MMRSATAFLPDSMTTFMNLDRSTEPNFGSGRISRLGTSRRRGMGLFLFSLQLALGSCLAPRNATQGLPLTRPAARRATFTGLQAGFPVCAALCLLGALRAVLGARLLAILDALQVERAAHDVVAHARQILHAAAAHQHDAVLLQVVAFAADVGDDLEAVG